MQVTRPDQAPMVIKESIDLLPTLPAGTRVVVESHASVLPDSLSIVSIRSNADARLCDGKSEDIHQELRAHDFATLLMARWQAA